ncbi:MAG: hypothetical protein H7829_08055 [Magnetococcus sp. THC-1_WYH]
MQFDPRTVARDIPGVFDEVFPQLTPSIVVHLNKLSVTVPIRPLRQEFLCQSTLQRAMLFELGNVVGERILEGDVNIKWSSCFQEALGRQRAYYDAQEPDRLEEWDKCLAEIVGRNLANAMKEMSRTSKCPIVIRPRIPGFEWIASGSGDFALGSTLVEIKCTAKRFSSADYRQVAIYWLLSYAASIEGHGPEWQDFVLFNPRSGDKVTMRFDAFLSIISSGRSKIDIFQLFKFLVGSRLTR